MKGLGLLPNAHFNTIGPYYSRWVTKTPAPEARLTSNKEPREVETAHDLKCWTVEPWRGFYFKLPDFAALSC